MQNNLTENDFANQAEEWLLKFLDKLPAPKYLYLKDGKTKILLSEERRGK
jgi:hypothetical protein